MPALVVEFTGARGVGKSTLANLVRAELQSRNVPYNRFGPLGQYGKVRLWLSGVAAHARFWILCMSWRPTSWSEMRVIQNRFRKYRFRMRRYSEASGIILLEEGIFQLMMMLHAKSAQKKMSLIADQLGRLVPFPDLVVFVGASEEAIEARRLARGNRRDLLKPQVSTAGRAALTDLKNLLAEMSLADGALVMWVTNRDLTSLGAAAAEVAATINSSLEKMNRE